MAIMQYSIKTV